MIAAVGAAASGCGGTHAHTVVVTVSRTAWPQAEPSIAVDPAHSSTLLAASIDLQNFYTRIRSYSSTDGGQTWSTRLLPLGFVACGADPSAAIAADGREYLAFIGREPCQSPSSIFVAHRRHPGSAWVVPTRPVSEPPRGALDDHPSLAVDPSRRGRLYVVWARYTSEGSIIELSRSDDGGVAWSRPTTITSPIDEGRLPTLAVGKDGRIDVAYLGATTVSVASAPNDASSFSLDEISQSPTPSTPHCPGRVPIPIQRDRCVDAQPTVVATGDSPLTGIAVAYGREAGGRERATIAVLDSGLVPRSTFAPPFGSSANSDQFLATGAFDTDTHELVLCYYDTAPDRTRLTASFTCVGSSDGGRRWGAPVPLAPRTTAADPNSDDLQFGDYERVAAAGGVAHPIWIASLRSDRAPRRRRVVVETASIPEAVLTVRRP